MLPRLQNKFIENSSPEKNFPESFNVCLAFREKWFCIRQTNFAFQNLHKQSIAHKIRFRLFADFKRSLQETQIQGEAFWRFSTFASLSQKNSLVFVSQIWHFKALNQYSVAHKMQLRLLTDFKTTLQKTQIQAENVQKVLTFTWLSHSL